MDCTGLDSITIPSSVDTLGTAIFEHCAGKLIIKCNIPSSEASQNAVYGSKFTTIVVDEGVTLIGNYAFTDYQSATSITLPESVTSIGDYSFSGCTGLTAINLHNNLTSIGEGAFVNCNHLSAIDIPSSVITIGTNAFEGCTGKATIQCNIPSYVTGKSPFHNSNFDKFIVVDGVTEIGDNAFTNCEMTEITLPNSVVHIGERAFQNCSKLISIVLPEAVTAIADNTFNACRSLEAIQIPNGVATIGKRAFTGCRSLTSIIIPESMKAIAEKAFYSCTALTDVYCFAITLPDTENNAFEKVKTENATLHVPSGSLEAYKTTTPWSTFGSIVVLTNEDMDVKQLTNNNGQMTIYDLSGRKVTDTDNLKGGIYIINGRKVMVK